MKEVNVRRENQQNDEVTNKEELEERVRKVKRLDVRGTESEDCRDKRGMSERLTRVNPYHVIYGRHRISDGIKYRNWSSRGYLSSEYVN